MPQNRLGNDSLSKALRRLWRVLEYAFDERDYLVQCETEGVKNIKMVESELLLFVGGIALLGWLLS